MSFLQHLCSLVVADAETDEEHGAEFALSVKATLVVGRKARTH